MTRPITPTQRFCSSCGNVISSNEKVRLEIEGTYRELPSRASFAIQKSGYEYVAGTLRHKGCPREGVEYGD